MSTCPENSEGIAILPHLTDKILALPRLKDYLYYELSSPPLQSASSPKIPRARRRWAYITAGIAIVMSIGLVTLRWKFHGEALAQYVQGILAGEIRGKIQASRIDWPLSDARKLITGGWLQATITDFKLTDETGEIVIDAPRATVEIDVHAAISGNYRIRHARIANGGYVKIKMVPEPYPAHEYDDSVVSLVSAFYPRKSPSYSMGYTPTPNPTVDLRDFEVLGPGIVLDLEFPSFVGSIRGIRGGGFLFYGGSDPLGNKLYYSLAAIDGPATTAESASITIVGPGKTVELRDLQVVELAQLPSRWPSELVPRDIQYKLLAKGLDGLTVDLEGAILDSWIDLYGGNYKVSLDLQNAGELAQRFSSRVADGKDLQLKLHIDGPTLAPRLRADLRNLNLAIPTGEKRPPLHLRIDRAVPSWNTATDSGTMEQVEIAGGGGIIEVSTSFLQMDPLRFNLSVDIPKAIELGPYLPDRVAQIAQGTTLSGTFEIRSASDQESAGDLESLQDDNQQQRLDIKQLRLGKAHVSGMVFHDTNGHIRPAGLKVRLLDTKLDRIHGDIDLNTETLNLKLHVSSQDIGRWMRQFQVAPLAESVEGTIHVGGNFDSPTARSSNIVVQGVPYVHRLDANFEYSENSVRLNALQARTMGGQLSASGRLLLGKVVQLVGLSARGKLDLNKLPGIGALLKGDLIIDAKGRGNASHPELKVNANLQNWALGNETFLDAILHFHTRRNGEMGVNTRLTRTAGGSVDMAATLNKNADLQGELSLQGLPLQGLFSSANPDLPQMGGTLSAQLQLGGSTQSPTIDGNIHLLQSFFQNVFLGAVDIKIRSSTSQIEITGQASHGAISLHLVLSTQAPFSTELRVSLRQVELDRFFPEFSREYGARSWVSGTIIYRDSLLGRSTPTATVLLQEVQVLVDHQDEEGRPAPIRFRNRSPIDLAYADGKLSFRQDAVITGPTGDLRVSGSWTQTAKSDELNILIEGNVVLQLLEPYLQDRTEDMSGELHAEIKIVGPSSAPQIVGSLDISALQFRLAGQDAILNIPRGKIEFSNTQLSLTGLRIVVKDQHTTDISELVLSGGLGLSNFIPTHWAMRIEGELAGKLLLAIAPQTFSAAAGSAEIYMAIFGFGTSPDIDGTIELNSKATLSLTPRALRRELTFNTGVIRFTDQQIELEDITGTVDGEGRLTALNGFIDLNEWQLEEVDISGSARDLPFEIPNKLELSANLNSFRVLGGLEEVAIEADVEIVDGRFIQNYNYLLGILQLDRSIDAHTSIFETVPLLGNAQLNLSVSTRSFFLQNNMANVEFNGGVIITGTPLKPNFDGSIDVVQGSFKIQIFRPYFERTTGQVSFSPGLSFPEETPIIHLESESDFRSTDGQDHLVQLSIDGPITQLKIDLSTSAGLDKAQTLKLALSGRTEKDIRKLTGGNDVNRRPGDFTPLAAEKSDNRLEIANGLTKDLASDLFAMIYAERLRAVTKLDVAKIKLGAASLGFHGEKDFIRSLKLIGDIERSFTGWHWDIQGKYRVNDSASIDLGYRQAYFDDEADEDEDQIRLRGTVRGVWIP